jgi:hypothetical protein
MKSKADGMQIADWNTTHSKDPIYYHCSDMVEITDRLISSTQAAASSQFGRVFHRKGRPLAVAKGP